MSAPSLSDRLALVAADPALVGHPVVAGLVVAVDALETELAELRARVAAQGLDQIQQPFTQCRRGVVRTVGRPEPSRQQPCVNAPYRIASLRRIQLDGCMPDGLGKAID